MNADSRKYPRAEALVTLRHDTLHQAHTRAARAPAVQYIYSEEWDWVAASRVRPSGTKRGDYVEQEGHVRNSFCNTRFFFLCFCLVDLLQWFTCLDAYRRHPPVHYTRWRLRKSICNRDNHPFTSAQFVNNFWIPLFTPTAQIILCETFLRKRFYLPHAYYDFNCSRACEWLYWPVEAFQIQFMPSTFVAKTVPEGCVYQHQWCLCKLLL